MEFVLLFLSVVIGGILGHFLKPQLGFSKMFLTFSGAFLLTITCLEMFPQIFSDSHSHTTGLLVLMGVFLQIILEGITRGAEHGHTHHYHNGIVPKSIIIGLFLHAFLEGLPISNTHNHHLLYGILVHKIPVAMVLYLTIRSITDRLNVTILYMSIFALASPLGALVGKNLNADFYLYSLALLAGIFLHISTVILFESSSNHKLKLKKFIVLLSGFALAYFTIH